MPKAHILIVDDDARIQDLLRIQFSVEGHLVEAAINGEEAIDLVERRRPDVIILDLSMPDMNGFEVCRAIRAMPGSISSTWIIVLSAMDLEVNKLRALNDGADVFLAKPFSLEVLQAYIYAGLRRIGDYQIIAVSIMEFNGLRINFAQRRVYVDDKEVKLRPLQFNVLEYLARNAGSIVTPETLIMRVWQDTDVDSARVRTCIRELRLSLGDNAREPRFIETKIGIGYSLRKSP